MLLNRIGRPLLALTTCVVATGLVSCSSAPDSTTEASSRYAVENCGASVEFDAVPERVVVLKSAPVATLDGLGVLDQVVAKAGNYAPEYFSAAQNERLADIKTLTDRLDATGHLLISKEAVVAEQPDLVVGFTDTVNRNTLGNDVPIVEEPAFCEEESETREASFENLWEEIRMYGEVFQRQATAEEFIGELSARVDELETNKPGEGKSVAVLYPSADGGPMYAYGHTAMAHAVVEAAGLENVFSDSSDRVFEVSAEELVGRNPDYIIALYDSGDDESAHQAVKAVTGAQAIGAIQEDRILPMLFNFAEPPTPLAVDGLERVAAFIEDHS